ncbi:hypothetical protein GYMLUDRAFT_979650 [Collybiopsis luxurians FD-317 M1]|uniref:Unplaced genomic scaffold GYMLUscaffold_102, whole genome shotgun sequence n=1 Tax=Collybiopsis luxurians FD-317 M1 TaxID=944289 RepID=A0A0D0AP22_9AGAR|nr:hypothetical protein GYMLUDRAFT_979650 [Collybiopsis luxurians FD-317 M1]
MDSHSRLFNALPNELHLLIAKEIGTDISSICALTSLSRRTYAVYNSFLYQCVNYLAVPTLALTPEARLPLSGPHPAAFVQHISLGYYSDTAKLLEQDPEQLNEKEKLMIRKGRIPPGGVDTFKNLGLAAMANIISYAPHTAIKGIEYECEEFSLADVLDKIEFPVLTSLNTVLISCPFPTATLRRMNLDLLFDLEGENDPPDSNTLAGLLRHAQQHCPNIKHLGLSIPEMRSGLSPEPIQQVLDDPAFVLLLLEELYFFDDRGDQDELLCQNFLHRHPNITPFEYIGALLQEDFASPVDDLILPNLVHTTAVIQDGLSLCMSSSRPIECLCLFMIASLFVDDWLEKMKEALGGMKTLHRLILDDQYDWSDSQYTLREFGDITSACPNLTHLECTLNIPTEHTTGIIGCLPELYETLARNLPALKHFKVVTDVPSELPLYMVRHHHLVHIGNATRNHQTLEMVEVQVFSIELDGTPVLKAEYYFAKDGQDVVLAKKEDRCEFGRSFMAL